MFLDTDKIEKTLEKFTYPFLIHMDDIPDILNLDSYIYFLWKISLKCKPFFFNPLRSHQMVHLNPQKSTDSHYFLYLIANEDGAEEINFLNQH